MKPFVSHPLPQSQVLEELEAHAKSLVVDQMKQRGLSYENLSERLQRFGIVESPQRLNRKVNRMKFQASFLLACLVAMEVEAVPLVKVDVSRTGRDRRLRRAAWDEREKAARRRRPLGDGGT